MWWGPFLELDMVKNSFWWSSTTWPNGWKLVATSSIKAKDVVQFVYKNICTRFKVPIVIVTDHGPSFRSEMLARGVCVGFKYMA